MVQLLSVPGIALHDQDGDVQGYEDEVEEEIEGLRGKKRRAERRGGEAQSARQVMLPGGGDETNLHTPQIHAARRSFQLGQATGPSRRLPDYQGLPNVGMAGAEGELRTIFEWTLLALTISTTCVV